MLLESQAAADIMEFQLRARVASAVTACLIMAVPVAGASAKPRHHHHHRTHRRLRLPADYAAWTQVTVCESGGWRVLGSSYPDPFGITAINWAGAGGSPMPVGPVALASRAAAIKVADRFRHQYGISVPDQGGCSAW